MISEMIKYDFILLSGEQNAFLAKLQSMGVMDITRSTKAIDEHSEKLSVRGENLRKALAVLKNIVPATSTEAVPKDIATEVLKLVEEKENLKAQRLPIIKERDECKPWGHFDSQTIAKLQQEGLKLHFYKLKSSLMEETWKEQYALREISSDGTYTYFVIISDTEDYSFPLKEVTAPENDYQQFEREIAHIDAAIAQKEARLSAMKLHEAALQAELEETVSKLDLHLAKVSGKKHAEDYITVFEGFAPSETESKLREMLDQEPVLYLTSKAEVEDNPPIKLKNNKFVSMFEVLTDMYGRPKYNEFDPTPWISIFFMLFFAFCMGDAGYGLILILLGFGLKKIIPKIAPLVVTLGVATAVIGLLFHTFFSTDMLSWGFLPDVVKKCMLPSKIGGYDGTMVLAIIVGIVHICMAMMIKTYYTTKNKGFLNSLETRGWTLLIVGGVIVGGLSLIGVLSYNVTKWVFIVIGVVSTIEIYILNDIHRKVIFNIGAGLWSTYNTATGLLGDVLSYLRLYALGLAGAKLGEAFNAIGTQALGDGGIGWIWFILIVVVGHALNIAMCVLGAFVHPLRLNFLEFFKNSGYEGSGRSYKPMSSNQGGVDS